MSIVIEGNTVTIDGRPMTLQWPILSAVEEGEQVFVLFDPDRYLVDPNYKKLRQETGYAVRNLIALTRTGTRLWEAELPEANDYYYRISSSRPLVANSFSSYKCHLDPKSGLIVQKEFLK